MISSRSPAALEVALKPSRYLLLYLVLLTVLAVVSVSLVAAPLWVRLAAIAAVVATAAAVMHRRVLLRSAHSVIGLAYRDGQWWVRTSQSDTAVECHSYTVWPWLVALDLRAGRRRFRVLVLPDQLDADSLRRLRQLAIHCAF